MARTLDVYLHRHLVGKLVQNEQGDMLFDYAESWLANPAAIPLSYSLPLTQKHFNRQDCRAFFAGILPEESKREIIAHNLGISATNDFAMLEQIGGECAGAVTFIPAGQNLPERENAYRVGRQTRFAPLYDLISTITYPELSPKMAMKIGGEYLSDKISAKHFEKLAEEAGLAKPMVKRRVPELAESMLAKMPDATSYHPFAEEVEKLIQRRCVRMIQKFKP